ncbi:MAG: TorF family putative porin, partial [Methylomonas sp.]
MPHRRPINGFLLPVTGLIGLCCLAGGVDADWRGNLRFRSEYVYRGYTKSLGDPVGQAELDYLSPAGWFAGLGLSQVTFDRNAAETPVIEIKPAVGWSLPITADWSADIAAYGYVYNSKIFHRNSDYAELNAALHFKDAVSLNVYLAPNAYQRQVNWFDYELGYRRDLTDTL